MTTTARRKLIEVALPLDAINTASAREKSIRHGHPSTLHLWWSRKPLAAARAVIFAQLVDDPSAYIDDPDAQEVERQRLFTIIEQLVLWENTTNETVLEAARAEIRASWRRTCADNADHPRAAELFDPERLPPFHDPFAGGGSLPLEAQRLGLEAHASDLNPVAVLINKAMIEIPPKFAGWAPVNPAARGEARLTDQTWRGAEGLADDVRYYGQWMRDEAERRIGRLYPKVVVTLEMAEQRPDLEPYVGRELTVIAWLWARTVKSPNPAFADVDVPLASTFILSKKKGKEAWVEPIIDGQEYRFEVRTGKWPESAVSGTKAGRARFRCLLSGTPISTDYVKSEGIAGRMDAKLMALVAEGDRGRVYLPPVAAHEQASREAKPTWKPETDIPPDRRSMFTPLYGLTTFGDLFTDRQLVALTTFSDLVAEAREQVRRDAVSAGLSEEGIPLRDGGVGALAYSDAVCVYLALGVGRQANRSSSMNFWDNNAGNVQQVFARQAIPMVWGFVESNPIGSSTGGFVNQVSYIGRVLNVSIPSKPHGFATQADARRQQLSVNRIISTDPPYYDNIGYADLSDFFYTWLRRSLRMSLANVFPTVAAPKDEELIAAPYRHGSKRDAETFFLDGMGEAMKELSEQSHRAFPVTIYYAFKQAEAKTGISTGWETFLAAVIEAGFGINGTWPARTEYTGNLKAKMNALASSIILVCRPRPADAPTATRREFQDRLRFEFPDDLAHLQRSNIAPVDLAQASIGPGMRIFTEYRAVLNADGSVMSVREALALINATLDEALAEQEGEFEPDSRWALTWCEQHGFAAGEFGDADVLAKAKGTSPDGLVEAGLIESRRGKVRLYRPVELPADWNPASDGRITVWEMTHHLIRRLESAGEESAAELAAQLGGNAETARELAYRLYVVSDRKNRAEEARQYNALVQSWPEIIRLSKLASTTARQSGLEFAEQ